jgi:hypothetical protein
MIRRASIIGTLTLGLMLTVAHSTPAWQNFQRYYRDLKDGGTSMNPVERVVVSLVLANR